MFARVLTLSTCRTQGGSRTKNKVQYKQRTGTPLRSGSSAPLKGYLRGVLSSPGFSQRSQCAVQVYSYMQVGLMSDEAEMHGREAKALCGANSIRYHPLLETAAYEVTGERRLFCLYCLHSAPYTLSFILPSLTLCIFSYTAATSHRLTIYCFLLFLAYISVHSRPACIRLLGVDFRCPRHATRFASLTPYLLVPPSRSWTAGRTSPAFRTLRVSLSTIHCHTRNT